MKKLVGWVKKQKYQWENPYLKKLCDKGLYTLIGIMVLSFGIQRAAMYLEYSDNIIESIAIAVSMIAGVCIGFLFATRYIDEKLKK